MFENSGEKIKFIAKFVFGLTVFISYILAINFGYANEIRLLPLFGFLIGIPLLSYVSTLFLVAFGDLVQNVQSIKNALVKSEDVMQEEE